MISDVEIFKKLYLIDCEAGMHHINDLPNELVCKILDFVPLKQLFGFRVVCKKWQTCVQASMAQRETLLRSF